MTLDELLGLSSAELDKIPPTTIQAFFEPYLNVTRPERQTHEKVTKSKPSMEHSMCKEKQEKLAKARALAEQFGLKI